MCKHDERITGRHQPKSNIMPQKPEQPKSNKITVNFKKSRNYKKGSIFKVNSQWKRLDCDSKLTTYIFSHLLG